MINILVNEIHPMFNAVNAKYVVVDILPAEFDVNADPNPASMQVDGANIGDIVMENGEVISPAELEIRCMSDANLVRARIREDRRIKIMPLDVIVARHKEQLEIGVTPTLTQEEYLQVLHYRQALRDFPETVDMSVNSYSGIQWPEKPGCI